MVIAISLAACSDPSAPPPSTGIVAVSAGNEHTCAVQEDGVALCWGNGAGGRIGNGGDTAVAHRVSLPTPVNTSVRFTQIAAGEMHTCALTSQGRAYCWGMNQFGQLGDGTTETRRVPVPVAGNLTFSSIGAGAYHTCAVAKSAAMYCWGDNEIGQLGQPDAQEPCGAPCSRSPVAVAGTGRFKMVAVGGFHTCGITTELQAFCWGYNYDGQTGAGYYSGSIAVPTAVATSLDFTSIVAGAGHSCALTADGVAYCWGGGEYGQIGNGEMGSNNYSAEPVPVLSSLRYSTLSAGGLHTCGVSSTATLCWGSGPLGNAVTGVSTTPVAINTIYHFVSLDAGAHHQCVVDSYHSAFCWGDNTSGQVGTGSSLSWIYTPVAIVIAVPIQ